jgi:hypothetical protein
MKGWLDNFGKADNANDSDVSLPEGFVGIGYDTKGRNYSPAWGGQFQYGGIIPIAQSGVTEYMNKKMQDKKDATIAKEYDLPEVVVEAIPITQWNDPDKPSGYPQYTPKPGDNVNSPGWDIAEFYKSWVSSPEYERRMKNTGYYDAGKDKFYAKNLKKDIRISYDQYLKNQREGRMGALESTQEPGFIQIEPALYMGRPASRYTGLGIDIHPEHTKTPEMFETTLAHEIGHAIDSTTNFEDSLITSSMLPWSEFNKPFYSGVDPVSGNPIITQKDDIRREQAKHVRNAPQEFKSDLQALRYLMYDRGVYDIRKGKKFTKEDLERAKEKLKGNQSLERTIQAAGENGLIKLMNIIAKGNEEVTPIAMGGMSIPGSVGFTYARTGSTPSNGKYAKKTMASAQNGKGVQKNKTASDVDSTLENIFEIIDPSGMSSWEDVYKSYQETGMSPGTKLEIFGALPLLGKVGKFGKFLGPLLTAGYANKRLKTNAGLISNILQSVPYMGRGTDATQAIQQYSDAPFFPTAPPASVGQFGRYAGMPPMDLQKKQNGGEMRFYQNGLDWQPKNMRDGGITKDNRGYWNPDNWGKPVEIDSNMITMQGVYEPLLGISDTGDTKLMQPGKDYKFNGKKVREFPIAQEGLDQIPREQYLSKFKTYDNVLKSMNYTTPYYKDNNIDTSEGDMNCINGVCRIVSNISGVKFDKAKTKDTYTGNATFADNAMDEGYYRSNPEKEGFGVGDIFQYSRKKSNMASRFPGEVDFRNENDLYPNHAVLIVDEFEKDGQKHFKIANNAGSDKVKLEDVSESELMDRYKKGYKTYDGGITYRYDPDKVTSLKKEKQQKVNVLKGSNPYAGQYSNYDSSNLSFYNNAVKDLKPTNELAVNKNLQKYADVYSTVYKDLGKGSNMPIDSFNKLILNQIGIAGQETKFGELSDNSKDLVPDSLLPIARRSREVYNSNFGTIDNWKKDYWEKNADNVQSEFSSYEDFVQSLDPEDSEYSPYRTPRSVGVFQQKDLSERGSFYNYDLDSFEGQVKSSLALAVDNYHKLKAKYPDLSEDEIIDLTTLMHNAPGKALEPRFVNYYLKNKDVDYIDKVKSFKPQTIGKKPSTTTKKNEEVKFEKISPEKAKSIVDYVSSLQQSKRNGGSVGINQLDAQPMKKLNQLLNFTNNPDKDNWLDKYN